MHDIDEPLLSFNYVDSKGKKKPLTFKKPQTIIATSKIEEVLPCLQQVQDAVDRGYYAAGFISYEAAPAFDSAFDVHHHNKMPLIWFGIFDEPTDEPLQDTGSFEVSEWETAVSDEDYRKNIGKIKTYIENGDTYQVNYTIRLNAKFTGDTKAYYKQLAEAQSADYAAYLNTGDYTILSASPELFFQLNDGTITTRPMKGTIKRGKSSKEDIENKTWLYNSEKNRAENVMIVDLLRNDLGSIARPGTVRVPNLFTIEKYPTVYQMTSTVTAETDSNISEIFKALFPCGSITGAPKISTMRIINELENTPREVYCGTIGYITPEKEAVFNVPIRTVAIDNATGNSVYGVGGGVTWDSTAEDEYDEILTKAKLLKEKQPSFQLLETFGLNDGNYLVYDFHISRLEKSAAYFGFRFDLASIKEKLLGIANDKSVGSYRVRLLVAKDGTFSTEVKEAQTMMGAPVQAALATSPIRKDDTFLYHKTTNRTVYHYFQNQHPEVFDVLLWNEQHELTEFTLGNVVVELGGNLYTPPVTCGLLPGTFREMLLREGKIAERIITVDELNNCSKVWMINSLRKWVEVNIYL